MSKKILFAGVDGGSTKTFTVLADGEGHIVGTGETGPSNYHVVGVEKAIENIYESILIAAKRIDFSYEIEAITLGLAGMDTKYDFQFFEKNVAGKLPAKKIYVRHDAEIALVGATGGKPGIIVIAGTGSAAGGRNRKGKYLRCGGWGYILGDEGSAYYLGKRALMAVLWAYDGRGEKTILRDLVIEKMNIKDEEDIIRKVYVEKMTVKDIAALAPLVTQAALKNDEVALQIFKDAAKHLALHVIALVKRLEMEDEEEILVATIGGVWKAGDIILNPFKEELEKHFNVKVIKPMFPPAVGALLISYMFNGIEINNTLLDNIRKTLKE